MISLRALEIYYWTAKLSSFSRAAEKLNTTQPTVSQRILALEEHFGRQLMNRASKPVSLTRDGQRMFAHVELILQQIAKLNQDFDQPGHIGSVRLGVSETIVHTWLGSFLEASHQCFPQVDFEISVDVTPELQRGLSEGELDIAFMLGPASVDGLACHHLQDSPMQFYAAPDLIPGNHFKSEHIGHFPILTYPRHAYPHSQVRELLQRRGGQQPRIFPNSSLSTMERMAVDRIGVALVAQGAFQLSLEQGKLVALKSDLPIPVLPFYSFYLTGLGDGVLSDLTTIAQTVAQQLG